MCCSLRIPNKQTKKTILEFELYIGISFFLGFKRIEVFSTSSERSEEFNAILI